ncbi:hypothetical protein Golomagni_07099, partial [Golovinomyces magnicellulatus]
MSRICPERSKPGNHSPWYQRWASLRLCKLWIVLISSLATNGIVLATEKKSSSPLADQSSLSKISNITPNIGSVYSGMGPDYRVLVDRARKVSHTDYKRIYNEYPPTRILVQDVARVMQEATQSAGVRPYGVSMLIAGWDDGIEPENEEEAKDDEEKKDGIVVLLGSASLVCEGPNVKGEAGFASLGRDEGVVCLAADPSEGMGDLVSGARVVAVGFESVAGSLPKPPNDGKPDWAGDSCFVALLPPNPPKPPKEPAGAAVDGALLAEPEPNAEGMKLVAAADSFDGEDAENAEVPWPPWPAIDWPNLSMLMESRLPSACEGALKSRLDEVGPGAGFAMDDTGAKPCAALGISSKIAPAPDARPSITSALFHEPRLASTMVKLNGEIS